MFFNTYVQWLGAAGASIIIRVQNEGEQISKLSAIFFPGHGSPQIGTSLIYRSGLLRLCPHLPTTNLEGEPHVVECKPVFFLTLVVSL